MAVSGDGVAVLAAKFAVVRKVADERTWRVYLGSEALALGRGGVSAVALAAGVSQTTVAAGVSEIGSGELDGLPPGRSRRPGAGRKKAEDTQPGLRQALRGRLEEATRGDPVSEITWCSLSLRDLERQLAALGFRCGKDAIARMLCEDGYSLQGMARVLEGRQHPDRDAQFRHINAVIAEFTAAGDPAVSVDTKKKEQLGPYHRDGRSWRPKGSPVRVRDHDFPDEELGKITPYGIYDIAANTGFVSVGTSHDTAAFAVSALRLWWRQEGSLRYPGAGRLLVICDAGGSNGHRCRLWKDQLAVLAEETGLKITVCHFPPGTSKWNKIEHRLFCHITRTWRARPLMTKEDAVAGIAATTTYQGLKCAAVLDPGEYPTGREISGERMKHLEDRVLDRQDMRGEWNYAVLPAPAPGRTRNRPPAPGRTPPCSPPWPACRHRRSGSTARRRRRALAGRPRAAAAPGPRRRPPQGQRRRPQTAPVRGHRHRRRLPPAAGHALPAARRVAGRPRDHHQPRRPPHHPAPGRTRHHPATRRHPHRHPRSAAQTRRNGRNHPPRQHNTTGSAKPRKRRTPQATRPKLKTDTTHRRFFFRDHA